MTKRPHRTALSVPDVDPLNLASKERPLEADEHANCSCLHDRIYFRHPLYQEIVSISNKPPLENDLPG
jgi:hypothetical protein